MFAYKLNSKHKCIFLEKYSKGNPCCGIISIIINYKYIEKEAHLYDEILSTHCYLYDEISLDRFYLIVAYSFTI
jgi:hypothetical protein